MTKQGYSAAEAQQLESFFANSARLQLKPEVIADSRIMDGLKIKNPDVIKELTKDGSIIENWGKFSTKQVNVNSNRLEIHYYKNIITEEINVIKDFKVKYIKPKK